MTYEPVNVTNYRQRLLTHPSELQDVDYKSSIKFSNDDHYSLKLIQQIQGMANAGGGWLVIGFVQSSDQNWIPDPNHSSNICPSYDPTKLSQQVDTSIARGQQIHLKVHYEVHPLTKLQYPIIQIEGFERLPYICRSKKIATDSGKLVLEQGAVYLRRPGAETAPVSTPQDWELLVNRCVRMRRDEFISEFRDLFERMTSASSNITYSQASKASIEDLSSWMDETRLNQFRITGE
jgi:hypothetical protein